MHIWENGHQGTDGCTAMEEANILRVLHWINAGEHPLLVQLPDAEYKKLRKKYGLPAIKF
jgi:D-alanyl-D-alanine dipeptidase